MGSVKVSVITPFYNVEKYAEECLDSVLTQSLEDIEVICIDDGSTDGTAAILERYSAKDPRVVVLKQGNSGPSAGRNRGLSLARGEYVSFVDSDDFLAPGALEKCYTLAREYGADMVHFNAETIFESKEYEEQFQSRYDEQIQRDYNKIKYIRSGYEKYNNKGEPTDGPALFSAMFQNGDYKVPIWLCFFRGDFVRQHQFRFIDAIYHADDEFTFKAMLSSKSSAFIGEILYCRRFRPDSIMTTPIGRWDAVSYITGHEQMQLFLGSTAAGMRPCHLECARQYLENHRQYIIANYLKYLSENDAADAEYINILDSFRGVKVSVIMPVYNAGDYLQEAVDSVLTQTMNDIELICVDDCSDDSSPAILAAAAAKDSRTKVIRAGKHSYAGIARNTGMKAARGEYLAFLDADDFMEPDCLEHQYALAKKHDADYVRSLGRFFSNGAGPKQEDGFIGFGDVAPEFIDTPLSIFDSNEAAAVLANTEVIPWASLFKRAFIETHGVLFNDLYCANDCSFQRAVLFKAKRCVLDPYAAVSYRIGNESSLIGARAKRFDCILESVGIVRELAENLPEGLRQLFMRRELLCLHAWYLRLKDEESVMEKTIAYISAFEDDLGREAKDEPWFPDFFEIKTLNNGDRFFGVTASDIAENLRACGEIADLHRQLDECAQMADSYSYWIGHKLTAPFRKIRALSKRDRSQKSR